MLCTCYEQMFIHVLYMYSTCTSCIQCQSAWNPELEKLIFITCKSADSGKMLAMVTMKAVLFTHYNAVIEWQIEVVYFM